MVVRNKKPSAKKSLFMRKIPIPKALREQVWIAKVGKKFQSKCLTPWCTNTMNVFDQHCSHDIPESAGGATSIENLIPLCARCNLSMGNEYTYKQWSRISPKRCSLQCLVPWWSATVVPGIESPQRPMSPKDRRSRSPGHRFERENPLLPPTESGSEPNKMK